MILVIPAEAQGPVPILIRESHATGFPCRALEVSPLCDDDEETFAEGWATLLPWPSIKRDISLG